MEDMQVYIANLGKYVEGELVGAWFHLPINFDEVKEKIGLNDDYEEYAIHDYELPFKIDEYISIEKLNDLYELVEELEERGIPSEDFKAIEDLFSNFEEMAGHADDIIFYPGLGDMTEVAEYLVKETGMLDGVPDNVQRYFDYEAFGRDLENEGNYVIGSQGIYKYAG